MKQKENWLEEAKQAAKEEAEEYVSYLINEAERRDIESWWYIEEVVKNIHKIKDKIETL